MTRWLPRLSVAFLIIPSLIALPFIDTESQIYLTIAFVATVAFAIQAAVSEPKDLLIATCLALAPIVALVGDAAPGWMIGPLTVSVLVGAELNALAWASQGASDLDDLRRRRLEDVARLAAVSLVAVAMITAASFVGGSGGALAWTVAAAALVGIGRMVFRPA